MCFVQETKVQQMKESMVSDMWRGQDVEWNAKEVEGQSGGILTMWRPGVIDPIFSFRRVGFIGIRAYWKGKTCYFINIYSYYLIESKSAIWMELMKLKSKLELGEWIVRMNLIQ